MKKLLITLLCSVALVQGCSKGAPDAPGAAPKAPVSLNDANSAAAVKKAVLEKKAADAPHADKSVPLTQYQELTSGKQLMFAYLAIDTMPMDYEKIAAKVSPAYSGQTDEFKKRDMLNALKPGIDKEVAKAKEGRYFFMHIGDNLDKYDFPSKSFGNPAFNGNDSTRYFNDDSAYQLKFTNNSLFNKVAVPDEERARMIESLRAKYQGLRMNVYFFMSESELGNTVLKSEITKLQVTDSKGNVLAEI